MLQQTLHAHLKSGTRISEDLVFKHQFPDVEPVVKLRQTVRTDQQNKPVLRRLCGKPVQRINRIGNPSPLGFDTGHREMFRSFRRQPEHRQPVLKRNDRRILFMRRDPRGSENDLIGKSPFQNGMRQPRMSEMRRIERPAIKYFSHEP